MVVGRVPGDRESVAASDAVSMARTDPDRDANRRSAGGARKSEFDLKSLVWTVPGDRMKVGVEHRVPLSPRAFELSADEDLVFPSSRPGRFLSNMVFLMALRRMKVATTAHGFRSSFKDWASERHRLPERSFRDGARPCC